MFKKLLLILSLLAIFICGCSKNDAMNESTNKDNQLIEFTIDEDGWDVAEIQVPTMPNISVNTINNNTIIHTPLGTFDSILSSIKNHSYFANQNLVVLNTSTTEQFEHHVFGDYAGQDMLTIGNSITFIDQNNNEITLSAETPNYFDGASEITIKIKTKDDQKVLQSFAVDVLKPLVGEAAEWLVYDPYVVNETIQVDEKTSYKCYQLTTHAVDGTPEMLIKIVLATKETANHKSYPEFERTYDSFDLKLEHFLKVGDQDGLKQMLGDALNESVNTDKQYNYKIVHSSVVEQNKTTQRSVYAQIEDSFGNTISMSINENLDIDYGAENPSVRITMTVKPEKQENGFTFCEQMVESAKFLLTEFNTNDGDVLVQRNGYFFKHIPIVIFNQDQYLRILTEYEQYDDGEIVGMMTLYTETEALRQLMP